MNQQERATVDLVINGQQAKTSLKEVQTAVISLTKDLRKMKEADDPKVFAAKTAELKKMGAAHQEMNLRLKETTTSWQNFKKSMGPIAAGVVGGNLATAAIQQLLMFIPNLLSKMGELSDSFANIRKTTGMTTKEVVEFNAELKKIDTRTSTKDLREIAVVAGQLGIVKEDILGFTASVDKLNVALGDEFAGGAAEVADITGKLRNVFIDIKSQNIEQDLLHIGNALNELGATGAATGPVVADFANRIGGAGIPLGLTTGQVLGLSATLQELNVATERGGTAITKLLPKMLTHVEEFAGVAGLSMGKFKDLLNTDLYGAFIRVVKGAGASAKSSTEFAETLDALGIDGAAAMEVMLKLSGNTDLLSQRVSLAGRAVHETTSVINEFNLKNNNLAANMEKLSKRFSSWWDKSAFMGFFEGLVGLMADTRSEAEKLTSAFQEQKSEVQQLESKINPLIRRHDELKGKVNLNKKEQLELKSAIKSIAEIMPTAVTEWDKYGNAISINTGKAREFIAIQKALLANQNKDAISEARGELNKMGKERARLINSLNTAKEDTGYDLGEKVTNDIVNRITFLTAEMKARETLLKGLRGDMLDVPEIKPASGNQDIITPYTVLTAEQKKEADRIRQKAIDDAQKLADELSKIGDELFKDSLSKQDAEVEGMRLKYEKLREEAKGNSERLVEIANLEGVELLQIQKKNADEARKIAIEKSKEKFEALEEELKNQQQRKIDEIDIQAATGQISEFDAEGLKLLAEEQFLMAQFMLRSAMGMKNADLEKQIADNYIRQQYRKKDATQQINEAIADIDRNLVEVKQDLMMAGVGVIRSFLKEGSLLAKAAFLAEQINSIARIIMNVPVEISGIAAAPTTLLMPPILRESYMAKVALTAKIRAAAGITTIGAATIREFVSGGFTELAQSNNPGGMVNVPTLFNGRYIAGEKGEEWIAPNWMINTPATANILGALEALRLKGPSGLTNIASAPDQKAASYDFARLERMMSGFIETQSKINSQKIVLIKKHLDDIYDDEERISIDLNA